jgi:hypothetical protein
MKQFESLPVASPLYVTSKNYTLNIWETMPE